MSWSKNGARPCHQWLSSGLFLSIMIIAAPRSISIAGPYTESAHGDDAAGADRTLLTDYSPGNCSHCHEQHGSMDGQEAVPVDGVPAVFALFTENFNDVAQTGPYLQADNLCFSCHISAGALQSGGGITNKQYMNVFAGYPVTYATDILGAFNLEGSYHNLYNIRNVAETRFAFFTESSNPCVACHNPHLAKRNSSQPTDPAFTAISRPAAHDELWGDGADERMNRYTSYRAPYYYNSANTYEPGGTFTHDGTKTPDYNTFCLDCHQNQVPVSTPGVTSMNPSTPNGFLSAIDWGVSGDMHGERTRINDIDGSPKNFGTVIAPYNLAPVQNNYVTSCLDCHEPHGTILVSSGRSSSYLLRKEINNNVVEGCGGAAVNFCEDDFCRSCHTFAHCGGPQGCFACHYHGATNKGCGGPYNGPNF